MGIASGRRSRSSFIFIWSWQPSELLVLLTFETSKAFELCVSQDESVTDADAFERKWEEVKSNQIGKKDADELSQ